MKPGQPTGLYAAYLNALIEKHRREGRPAPSICDESYWETWRDQQGLNQAEAEGRLDEEKH